MLKKAFAASTASPNLLSNREIVFSPPPVLLSGLNPLLFHLLNKEYQGNQAYIFALRLEEQ